MSIEAIIGAIATLGSASIAAFASIYINRRKNSRKADLSLGTLSKHPVFDKIRQLKLESVKDMSTGNKLKDVVMKRYANLILDIYSDEMLKFAQSVKDGDGIDSISRFYFGMLERLSFEMEKSNIVPEYLERIFGESSVERSSLSNEITYIQKDQDLTLYQKIDKVFDSIRVHLTIIIGKLEEVTKAMNGHLEDALKKQKGN